MNKVTKNIEAKLDRLIVLEAALKVDPSLHDGAEFMCEFEETRKRLVRVFMPLIRKLVGADLLNINVDMKEMENVEEFEWLNCSPVEIWQRDGDIWMDVRTYCGVPEEKQAPASITRSFSAVPDKAVN